MLAIELGADGWPVLTQSVTSPAVYLDHCAVMEIAEHDRERFTKALLGRNGTLLLSWFHLLEFSRVKSPGTADAVEDFLEGLERHVAFLDPDAGKVIDAEDLAWSGRSSAGHPALDARWMDVLTKVATPPAIFAFQGLLRIAQKDLDAQWASFETGMAQTSALLEGKRNDYLSDKTYARNIKAPTRGPALPAPTRYVLREVMNELIRDARTVMDSGQWADYGHSIVAASYADLVVLDGEWTDRVTRAGKRLDNAGLLTRPALVYPVGTLGEFWSAFDV